ncbi:hypothetical protein LXL04_038564 [Taraxacum kok-saghyz]
MDQVSEKGFSSTTVFTQSELKFFDLYNTCRVSYPFLDTCKSGIPILQPLASSKNCDVSDLIPSASTHDVISSAATSSPWFVGCNPFSLVGFAHHLLDKMIKINIQKFTTSSDPSSSSFSGFDIPGIPDLTKGDTLKSLKLKLQMFVIPADNCFVASSTVSAGLIGTNNITLPLKLPARFCPVEMQRYKLLKVIKRGGRSGKLLKRERGQKWKLDYLDKLKKQKHTRIVYAPNYLSCLAMYFFTFITNNNVLIILS